MNEIPGRPSQRKLIDNLGREIFLGDFVKEGSSLDEVGLACEDFVPLEDIVRAYFPGYTEEQYERIQDRIFGRYHDLEGGCDMSAWDEIDLNQNPTATI